MPVGDLRHLPPALSELTGERRWVSWRWELDKQRRKWTKVPYQPDRPHLKASANRPETWSTHDVAVAITEGDEAMGIGYELADGDIAAFDLDDCRDPETGRIEAWAWTLIDEAQSYTEVTVSGTGLRIIGRALGGHIHRKFPSPGGGGSIEIYRQAKRFIVVTGLSVAGTCRELADIDSVIDAVFGRLEATKSAAGKSDTSISDAPASAQAGNFGELQLPAALMTLIRDGAAEGNRSDQFHHVVGWLKDLGWDKQSILSLLERFPAGIAAKYEGRLEAEVERSFTKTGAASDNASQKNTAGSANRALPLHWHGDPDDNAERKWLVAETIPETGKGLLSGQWGTGKTFVALDLAGSVMTGTTFAGRAAPRRGGVLFVAAEGANEVSIRLRGVVDHKLAQHADLNPAQLERLPFAWLDECPALTNRDALPPLRATVVAAADQMRAQFGMPLALIIIDTLMAAADFEDENDSAQGQKVMRVLEDLSRTSGAFALAVDHFGKVAETGTRGTSAKEGAADVVLALLGDKDMAGKVTNRRIAIRKLRGGATGDETPFRLSTVTIEPVTAFSTATTCVVEWSGAAFPAAATETAEKRWPKGLRVFKAALLNTIIDRGQDERPFGSEGPVVKAAPVAAVRTEFVKAYPAGNEDPSKRADTKRRAFDRAIKEAVVAQLAVTREVRGVDHIWLVTDEPANRTSTADRQDTS